MISELAWASTFFRRKMGKLKVVHAPFPRVETALRRAKAQGYRHIICKTQLDNANLIRCLESSGFYLSDIGITWSASPGAFFQSDMSSKEKTGESVIVATAKDIPLLRQMSKSLFLESRFYHDPFFFQKKKPTASLWPGWRIR